MMQASAQRAPPATQSAPPSEQTTPVKLKAQFSGIPERVNVPQSSAQRDIHRQRELALLLRLCYLLASINKVFILFILFICFY
jgi:hypothetical protein